MEYYEFRAMNSNIVLAAEGQARALEQGFEHARAFIENCEARFTRFREDSELSQLNRASGRWFYASPELYSIVREALGYFDQTGGLFDPSVLDALERAGYDRSMDEIRAYGPGKESATIAERAGRFSLVEFDEASQAIYLPAGLRIDLGGIAKGWIAERAAQDLAEFAPACVVNAGGDLYAIGPPTGETSWEIGLEDPRSPDDTLALLDVAPGAVATSSIMKRRWRQGESERHHLIDPRTGRPAETDWLSVTVMAPHGATAEVFAKALLIGGPGQAERTAGRRGDIEYIAVDKEGELWGSDGASEIAGAEHSYLRP